jgi:putative sterol carrier protein
VFIFKLTKSINGIFQFDIVQGTTTQSWTVDAKSETGSVSAGAKNGTANVVIEMTDSDFVGMMTGKLSARDLMADNKLKLTGDMTLAMKLRELASAIANLPKAKL